MIQCKLVFLKKAIVYKSKKKKLSIRKHLKIMIDPCNSILDSCLKKKVKINNKLKKKMCFKLQRDNFPDI